MFNINLILISICLTHFKFQGHLCSALKILFVDEIHDVNKFVFLFGIPAVSILASSISVFLSIIFFYKTLRPID